MRKATETSSRVPRALALGWLLASASLPAELAVERKLLGAQL
jgi:hypothetical protein